MSYTTEESAILTLITTNLSGYSSNNTKAGETDAAFKYANENGGNVCILDYAGGDNDSQESRFGNDQLWLWNTLITFFISYDASTIETDIRSLVNNFMVMYRDNKRLSTNSVWRVQSARAYEIYRRNDRPFVPISFLCAIKTPI